MMGLFGFIFDAALLTTAIAGVRRTVGLNVGDMLVKRWPHAGTKSVLTSYFNVGEVIVNRLADALNNPRNKLDKSDGDKKD